MRTPQIALVLALAAPGIVSASQDHQGCKLAASVIVAHSGRRVFKTTSDHYVGGALAIPAHSLVYTTGPDSSGSRRITKVWIGKNWTPGFVSFRATEQPAAGVLTPTSDRYTFTARFTKLPICYSARR